MEKNTMAKIELTELRPVGADLFSDSENYMNELGESEMNSINGGIELTPAVEEITGDVAGSIATALSQGLTDLLSAPA